MTTTMIDLRPKDREAINRFAKEIFPTGTEIWVYGSRVKGTAHSASDLDLVVKPVTGTELDSGLLSDFIDVLQNSTIPILVQVLAWDDVPERFRKAIEQEHKVMLVVS